MPWRGCDGKPLKMFFPFRKHSRSKPSCTPIWTFMSLLQDAFEPLELTSARRCNLVRSGIGAICVGIYFDQSFAGTSHHLTFITLWLHQEIGTKMPLDLGSLDAGCVYGLWRWGYMGTAVSLLSEKAQGQYMRARMCP